MSLYILSGACAEEPDFDTRYEEAEKEISAKAEAIDAELAGDSEEAKGETER
ncbi:hypothetical protein [Erythrobacter sp.]|uniref:hypothetical protein n=1 Tax=Erythrobacter sp. TaxID=1042 RepID=UPI001425BBA0|nr:hypothetical protein [Erythrobacter sp.]QIQ86956.1 MAG: hypothetical protein G9473_09855 [Erythrobacter sp.]